LPDRETDFLRSIETAIAYAQETGAGMVHVLAGNVPPDARNAARETYRRNIARAARRMARAGLMLLVEPINARDRPDYVFHSADDLADMIVSIDEPNVRLLFDTFHVGITDGDVLGRLARHIDFIGHIQIAAIPDRSEPDGGDCPAPLILDQLERLDYRGYVGLEYVPKKAMRDGLRWLAAYGVSPRD
jgi:hydroxypyruvate isomerase